MDTKSLIRHALTGLGTVLVLLGIGKYAGVIDFTLMNLDGVWQAGTVIVGFVLQVYGFFKGKVTAVTT